MDIFNMFSHIATVRTRFATDSTSMGFGTIFHYVFIQLLVRPCKQQE